MFKISFIYKSYNKQKTKTLTPRKYLRKTVQRKVMIHLSSI